MTFSLYNLHLWSNYKMHNLLDLFNNNGLDRFSIWSVSLIIVLANIIKEGSIKKDITLGSVDCHREHLPLLSLTWDRTWNSKDIMAAGGHHRHMALEEWLKQKELQVKKVWTAWQGMMNKKNDPIPLWDIKAAKVKYKVTQAMVNLWDVGHCCIR